MLVSLSNLVFVFFFSSRRRHTRCALVTGFRRVLFRSRKMNERGEPIPGLRKINRKEAEIVRQVFSRYQAGDSLRRISAWLNSLDIPSPRGPSWQPSAFIGTVSRQTGILRNPLYKGLVTFERMAYRNHPQTGQIGNTSGRERWGMYGQ